MDDRKPWTEEQAEGEDAARNHREHLLDEALQETFPASDVPSIAMPEDRFAFEDA